MSTIDAVIKFMNMEDKVLAFRDRRVLRELDTFRVHYDDACERVTKDMFPYYRLLCPDDQNFNNALYPTLYPCAVAWAKDRNLLKDDFTFMASTSPKLLALALEEDHKTEELYTLKPEGEKEMTSKDHIKRICGLLGIDAGKLLDELPPPEPSSDALERAKNMIPRLRGRPIQIAAVSQVAYNTGPQFASPTFSDEQLERVFSKVMGRTPTSK